MKHFRISAVIAAFAVLCVGLTCLAQQTSFPTPQKFVNPTGDDLPITATFAFFDPDMITRDRYLELKECGFNIACQSMTEDKVAKALKEVEGTGVKLRLYSWAALNPAMTLQTLKKYVGNPNIAFYHLVDEPKTTKFGDVKKLKDLFTEGDPNVMTHSNLLPKVSAKDLGAPDYKTYVEQFVRQVNPPFLSFDFYAVRKNAGKVYVPDDYYETLEVVSDVAKRSHRPFMAYVLATQHRMYPKATREYMRFNAFSQLAYGAQGLAYYTYCIPDFDNVGEYSNPPLLPNGQRSDVWYMVRDVNQEIRNLQHVFLGCNVVDVRHTGASIPPATKRLNDSDLPAPFSSLNSKGVGVMVSQIQNKGHKYLMLVNRDVLKKQKVDFKINAPVTQLLGDGKQKVISKNGSVTLTPGGYAIYQL